MKNRKNQDYLISFCLVNNTFNYDNDSLGGFEPVIDPVSGQITGYKTKVGADTVFPFKSDNNVKILGMAKHDQGVTAELFVAEKGMGKFTIVTDGLRNSYYTVDINGNRYSDANPDIITYTGIKFTMNNTNAVLGYATVDYPLQEGDVVSVRSGSGGTAYSFALNCVFE